MKRGNRGQVLVILAIAIFALLGVVALAVDLGYLWSIRHELQRCADAGALAGASRFIPPDTGPWEDQTVKDEAEARARDFASRDKVATSTLKPLPADNEIIVSFPQTDRIKVRTQRVVSLFFARVFGRQSQLVFAEAVAEAVSANMNVRCIVPWAIPLPWTDTDGDGIYDNTEVVHPPEAGCRPVSEWPITVYNIATHQIDNDASPPPRTRDDYLCPGSLRIMKIGDPRGTQEPGHFYALDYSSIVENCPPEVNVNNGAEFYNFMIKHPCDCGTKINPDDPLPLDLKTGDMVGPTIHAVAPDDPFYDYKGSADSDSLMSKDPTGYWDMARNLPNSTNAAYSDNNWMNSPRVVRIPLYDPQYPPEPGKSTITPVDFAGFWVQDVLVDEKGQGTVLGRFIPASAFAEHKPESGGSDTELKYLRLVK